MAYDNIIEEFVILPRVPRERMKQLPANKCSPAVCQAVAEVNASGRNQQVRTNLVPSLGEFWLVTENTRLLSTRVNRGLLPDCNGRVESSGLGRFYFGCRASPFGFGCAASKGNECAYPPMLSM